MRIREIPNVNSWKHVCDGCGDLPPFYINESPMSRVEYCLGCVVIMYGDAGITAEWLEARNVGFSDHIDDAKAKAQAEESARNMAAFDKMVASQ